MSVGVFEAALGSEQWPEAPRDKKNVFGLFGAPPVVFLAWIAAAILVISDHHEVVLAGGEGVAVEVDQGPVADSVGGNVGVAVEVAAQDAVALSPCFVAVVPDGRYVLGIIGVHGRDLDCRFAEGLELG